MGPIIARPRAVVTGFPRGWNPGKKKPPGTAGRRRELAQRPLHHQQQAEARESQYSQHQGVEQVDPQLYPNQVAHLGEQGQGGQPNAGAEGQPDQLGRRPAEEQQGSSSFTRRSR